MSRSTIKKPTLPAQQGVTLIELVIAIVIISIAAVALLQSLGYQTVRNVDPMIQSQAQALARQYLEEVLSKPFFDPSNDPRLNRFVSQANATASITNTDQSTANPTNRTSWNNIWEYDGYSSVPREINGTAINELGSFTVAIDVDNSVGLSLSSDVTNVSGCPAEVLEVTVTVTDPRGQQLSLAGYRTSYFDPPGWWGGC